MPEWIFVTTMMPGSYCSILPNGEEKTYTGLSLYLGVQRGKTPEEAFKRLYDKHGYEFHLADIHKAKVYAAQIEELEFINVELSLKHNIDEEIKPDNGVICEWCSEKLPPHGAARFSHLSKHVKQLVRKKLLTEEQASAINSLKLSDEIRKIFVDHFSR